MSSMLGVVMQLFYIIGIDLGYDYWTSSGTINFIVQSNGMTKENMQAGIWGVVKLVYNTSAKQKGSVQHKHVVCITK